MPKIVHLTEAWKGGIATYVEGLIKHQVESGGFDVHLICSKKETSKLNLGGFSQHFYQSSRNPLKFPPVIGQIKRIIKEINPDVIHAHSSFAGAYSRLVTLKKTDGTKIPVIYCAHGWAFCREIANYKKTLYKLAERFLLRNTTAIINLCKYDAEIAGNSGVKTANDRIIFSCVKDHQQTDNKPVTVPADKINIGFIGRFDPQKGYDFFIEQMQLCKRDDIKIHIIGGSVLKDDKIQRNHDYNYLGWVDNTKIDDYIKLLDVVVIPSRWEGFSLLVLEVMRNSKPVIVSNRTSLPEAVTQGINGYIFDFDNPATFQDIINKLDKNELANMGKKAREVFEQNFCGERHCVDTRKLYQEVIGL